MAGLSFTWLQNLGAIVDHNTRIQVTCTRCRVVHNFTREELVQLAERVGRSYSLINRRCPCRLTPGCSGWNTFYYLLGVYRPLSVPERRIWWNLDHTANTGPIGVLVTKTSFEAKNIEDCPRPHIDGVGPQKLT